MTRKPYVAARRDLAAPRTRLTTIVSERLRVLYGRNVILVSRIVTHRPSLILVLGEERARRGEREIVRQDLSAGCDRLFWSHDLITAGRQLYLKMSDLSPVYILL